MAEMDRLTVLVADDSRVILKAFSRIMSDHYDLVEAADGEAAWQQIESNDEICAVFSDWEMPNLNGLELTERIRASKNPRIKALPVIMVTSKTEDDGSKAAAFEVGANDFIAKPFDKTELLARAKTHAKRIHVSGEPEAQQAVLDPENRIGNAQYFQHQGNQMISFANRHNLPMAIVLVGIDALNALATESGASEKQLDEFVLTVGSHISTQMRQDDSIARLGKGIFGVLLSSADTKMAGGFTTRLRTAMAKENLLLNNKEYKVTLSMGIECSEPSRQIALKLMLKTARERLILAARDGDSIRPRPPQKQPLKKLASLDEAVALVNNKRADDVDMSYIMKRLFPLLVHFDKRYGTGMAQQALAIVKGEKKPKS